MVVYGKEVFMCEVPDDDEEEEGMWGGLTKKKRKAPENLTSTCTNRGYTLWWRPLRCLLQTAPGPAEH